MTKNRDLAIAMLALIFVGFALTFGYAITHMCKYCDMEIKG